jgi:lipopolysaccharide assembly protein A
MRTLYFLFLLAFIAALGIFAWQNQGTVTVSFLQWQISIMLAAVAGVSYLLGMLSGWSVVGLVRRSIHRVTDRPN